MKRIVGIALAAMTASATLVALLDERGS